MPWHTQFVREEYVGANRCWPCTAVNAVIVVVAALLSLAIAWPLAVAIAVGGALAIRYRGYVVPGTPQFAPKLVARLPVEFGPDKPGSPTPDHHPAGADGEDEGEGDTGDGLPDGEAIFETFVDAGVLHGDEELTLDEAFRVAWRDEMRTVREGDVLEATRDLRPDVDVERVVGDDGREWIVVGAGDVVTESWLDPAGALADVAGVHELTARGVPRDVALAGVGRLRPFLDRCPACDGALGWESEACCGGYGPDGPDSLLTCADCDAVVAVE